MKPLLTIATVVTGFLLISCSGSKQISIYQSDEPLPVDGSLSGWQTASTLLNSSDDIHYHAYIHDGNLYLFVDVRDLYVDLAIRQSGLVVYVSNSEETRRETGIGYPAGTFNLLRNFPGAYTSFTTDEEWVRKPENTEMMRELSNQIFDRIMIVERFDGSNPEYGFVTMNQIEIDGMRIATDQNRRFLSLEMKIPLDGSTIYNVVNGDLWVGFTIEPPIFRFRSDSETMSSRQQQSMTGYGYGGTQRRHRSQARFLSKNDWFQLRMAD
ncbi:MAG: hypothetical protein EA360_07940 [Balneolaceae bacterium]|nr:MAG: hypothetical protein EA360_07940 [Balneolaceae bacterium]